MADQLWCSATGVVDAQPVTVELDDTALVIAFEMERSRRAIPVADITGVEEQIGMMTGFVSIQTGAETLTLTRVPRKQARALADALHARVRRRPPDDPTPANATSGDAPPLAGSPLEELERLGRLRDSGVLTETEFAEAKRKLLGRL